MKSLEMPIRQGGDGMSGKSIISNSYLEDIGDAIRYKKGSEDTYYPSQMGDAIRSIEGIVPAGTLEIDSNGTYDVTEYAEAVVDVPDPVVTSLTVTEDGTYEVPSGVDGYNPVTVNTGIDALRSEIESAVAVSGCDPLVEGLTALTTYANEVTGASDTTLSDAVETLVVGYGQGGGVWTQKITVESAIALGGDFADLISNNLPSDKTFCVIIKENLNPSSFINNQLVVGVYDTANDTLNSFTRYLNGSYTSYSGSSRLWSNTYALTASVNDVYTMLYQ